MSAPLSGSPATIPRAAAKRARKAIDTRYGQMGVFANDTGAVTRSLVEYGEWAENELSFLRQLVPQGATAVDVGAYIGTHTLALAQFVGPAGRVVAIEPQAPSFALLADNVAANGLANVSLHHAAAGVEPGTIALRPIDPSQRASFGSASLIGSPAIPGGGFDAAGQAGEASDTVELLTIDSLRLDGCALIKVDAEGFEDLVIRGAHDTIRRFSPVIYAECNSLEGGLKTAEAMREFGYTLRLHVVDAFNPDNIRQRQDDIFGGARESALVALHGPPLEAIERSEPRRCELLLGVATADDLVLGMLNKPQYPVEVLAAGLAARSGAGRWLKDKEVERLARTEAALAEMQTLAIERYHYGEAAIAQARAARHEADAALQQRAQAMQQLGLVYQSRSWRVTAPLRVLMRRLGRE